jgi:hypothetical protein
MPSIATAGVDTGADPDELECLGLRRPDDLVWSRLRRQALPTAHRLQLAVFPTYELWHRGGVTLNRVETATRAAGRTARLRDVRCPRSRAVRRHSNKNGLVCVSKRGVLRRMQVADMPHKWLYEPDEDPKRKHHWNQNDAGFVMVGAVFVGKCPSGMSMQLAQTLLNTGIEWSPKKWSESYPQRIYCVWGGVLYRATPTIPGRSYHGFPEYPSRFPPGNRGLRNQILELARERDCEQELCAWMQW